MRCLYCEKIYSEKISFNNIFEKNFQLCPHCKNNININYYENDNEKLYYFAEYDEIKDIIYNIKYFGDVKNAIRFKYHLEQFFKNNKFDIITVAPTNNTRKSIRGFNPSAIILQLNNIIYTELFEADYREKQSTLHKKRKSNNVSILKPIINKINKSSNILIFDDIYTSGQTLKSLASCLRRTNPNIEITFLTLAKTKKVH